MTYLSHFCREQQRDSQRIIPLVPLFIGFMVPINLCNKTRGQKEEESISIAEGGTCTRILQTTMYFESFT